jgi:glycosyltransferase involved in cell wall biosynthesis
LFWPYVGGVEVAASRLLPALQQRGYEFEVVTSRGSLALPDEDLFENIPIHRFDFYTALAERRPAQILAINRRLSQVKQAYKPDLVHINFTDPSVFFHLRTAAAHPAPLLVSFRIAVGAGATAGEQSLLRQVLQSADWVLANSGAILGDLRGLEPGLAARSSIMYECEDLPDLAPAPLPFEQPVLLCLGRVVEDKGFDVAVEAFARLPRRFSEARLVIAGDGPARPALEQQAARLGVAQRVQFAGWIAPEQVPALINTATLILMPSRWREAFGKVAVEGGQMARPVIAARVGGLPEIVLHGQTGLLFDREDSQGLAEAIAYLLDQPALAERLGRAAREWVQAAFGWAGYLDAHDEIYRRLIQEKSLHESS